MIFPVVFQDRKGLRQSVLLLDLFLFPSGQQEILRIPMFRNPHVPFNSRVFLSDYETSIHCVPTLLTSFMFNWVNGPVAV